MKSQRIVATAQSKIAVEDFELPSLEPDQVLIETQFSAISPGTELAFLHHLPNTPGVYPYYPGYSSSGHVADKGSAVTDLEVGQRVACKIRHAAHAIVSSVASPVPKPFTSPYPLYTLVVHMPAAMPQKGGDPTVAVPAELTGQLHDLLSQRLLIVRRAWLVSLCGARMTQHPAGASLRDHKARLHVVNALATT